MPTLNGRELKMSEFFEFVVKNKGEILKQLLEHVELTLVALAIAGFVGVILGILIAYSTKLRSPILGLVNIIQTIPSLALLGFLLPFVGIGVVPAIIALFLYALLPIVRNTYTGIMEVDKAVKEAALAMGMTDKQILLKVELPLALPYIMTGIKTASVINVGVATLAAFIAAGGLGKFILQGIQLNNSQMILAGAIPASLLALFFDASIGFVQKQTLKFIKYFILFAGIALFLFLGIRFIDFGEESHKGNKLIGGFPSEFIYREDGLKGLLAAYEFNLDYKEMDIGLMYKALQTAEVDVISGFSTDGRIKAYQLTALIDDKHYFPPYEAAAMIRRQALEDSPEIMKVLNRLEGQISDAQMTQMNYEVDEMKQQPAEVAARFLKENSLIPESRSIKKGEQVVTIGSKAFTENYILAHVFALMIDYHTAYNVDLKVGFGGTKLLMDAMKYGEVDLYPEYTGTALLLLLDQSDEKLAVIQADRELVYDYVKMASAAQFNFIWSLPLGFNNTFALMLRAEQAASLEIESISALADYLEKQ
ncbi:MAG: osmoprotectant transport system permease protein [Marivirga sp.]|jgi:osmoprotectant transport system permease protein